MRPIELSVQWTLCALPKFSFFFSSYRIDELSSLKKPQNTKNQFGFVRNGERFWKERHSKSGGKHVEVERWEKQEVSSLKSFPLHVQNPVSNLPNSEINLF